MEKDHAAITPSVLRWARESAGYAVEEVGRKLGVRAARVNGWEDGSIPITFGRVERLADLYKRPSATFFMPKPPAEEPVEVPDFRASAGMSPQLRYQLRHARERRDIALQLAGELGQAVPVFDLVIDRHQEPEDAGKRLRESLGIPADDNASWKRDGRVALNAWKDATERSGVLVFQASRHELNNARGASLWFPTLPVVILASEAPTARAFTLLHELTHLALRRGGICDLHDEGDELYSNQVAAAALMPRPALLARIDETGARVPFSDDTLERLAKDFCVSCEALVLRLVELAIVDWDFYRMKKPWFEARARAAQEKQKSESGPSQPVLAIARNGRQFTQIVLEAWHHGAVTAHDAASYLNVAHRFVPEIVCARRAIECMGALEMLRQLEIRI